MWNLNNKTIVISGATNGIGKAAAIELSKENPKLLFTYRNQSLADEVLACTLSEIWTGTTDPQENTKKNRQELSAFLGGNILFQPSKTRWALKEDSKILGLIKVDFLH